jgi:hypothetical protein
MGVERYTYIENARPLADSGEYVTDIKITDPITKLLFKFQATNGGTSNKAQTAADVVDEIAILDGANVIMSLTGKQIVALDAYLRGALGYHTITEAANASQNLFVTIPFGRWDEDTELALSPKSFSNPQIRVRWNLANVRAVGATGFATGSATFSAIAKVVETLPVPKGYRRYVKHYSFTSAASGTEVVELPTTAPIRAIMLGSLTTSGGALVGLSKVRVTLDQGKVVVFEMTPADLKRIMWDMYYWFTYKHTFMAADGDTIYSILRERTAFSGFAATADTVVTISSNDTGAETLAVKTAGAAGTLQNVNADINGLCPHGYVYIPFGVYDDPNTWLQAQNYRSVRLELDQNAAGASVGVVLDTLQGY